MKRRHLYRALLVEEDQTKLSAARQALEQENFSVEAVSSAQAALNVMKVASYDLLITDLALPHISGEELMGEAESDRCVVVTKSSDRTMSPAFLQRICWRLEKPLQTSQLVLCTRDAA